MSTQIVEFDRFIKTANFWYSFNGIVAYDDIYRQPGDEPKRRSVQTRLATVLRQIFSFVSLANLTWVLIIETLFVVVNFVENADFLEAARNFTFMGFVIVAIIKYLSNLKQRSRLSVLMQKLYEIYPKQSTDQRPYDLQSHLRHYRRIGFIYAFLYAFTVWAYNSLPMVNYLLLAPLLQQTVYERVLPYSCWVPFEWRDNWLYYPLYVSQAIAGHEALAAYLASDLLLCAAMVQLIMHFRKLARDIQAYQAGSSCTKQDVMAQQAKRDLSFLSTAVYYHNRTLA